MIVAAGEVRPLDPLDESETVDDRHMHVCQDQTRTDPELLWPPRDRPMPARAPGTTDGFISQFLSIPSRIRRFVRLSSTTRTLTPRKISGLAHDRRPELSRSAAARLTVK